MEVNPSTKSSSVDLSGMSRTARRILESREQLSFPFLDARKIPVCNIMGGSSVESPLTTGHKRSRENDKASPSVEA